MVGRSRKTAMTAGGTGGLAKKGAGGRGGASQKGAGEKLKGKGTARKLKDTAVEPSDTDGLDGSNKGDDSEQNDNVELAGQLTKEQEFTQLLKKRKNALLGYAQIDLVHWPKPSGTHVEFHWGRMNKRAVVPSDVEKMVMNFQMHGRHPVTSPVALMVKRDWIDLEQLAPNVKEDMKDFPTLTFKEGLKAVMVEFMSGNHRRAACEQLEESIAAKVDALQTKIENKQEQEQNELNKEKEEQANAREVSEKVQKRRAEARTARTVAIATMQVEKNAEEVRGKDVTVWVAEVYDADQVDEELEVHLSANETRPQSDATKEEQMFIQFRVIQPQLVKVQKQHADAKAKLAAAQAALVNSNASKRTAAMRNVKKAQKALDGVKLPGTSGWTDSSMGLRAKFTQEDISKTGFQFMYKTQIGLDLLGRAIRFGYLQDGKVLTVALLKTKLHRMTKNNAKETAEKESKTMTAGYMWADVIIHLLDQMQFIAGGVPFPTFDANTCTQQDVKKMGRTGVALVNWLREQNGQPLLIQEDVETIVTRHHKVDLGHPAVMAEAQSMQKNVVAAQYEEAMENVRGPLEDTVWGTVAMDILDTIYVTEWKKWHKATKRRGNMGDANDADWNQMMTSYWYQARTKLEELWATAAKQHLQIPGSTMDHPRYFAYTNALRRFDWTLTLRQAGHLLHLPFPTKTFLRDYGEYVDSVPEGLRALVRIVDPLCDGVIRRVFDYVGTPDVFDYTGYLACMLVHSHMFKMIPSERYHLWQWMMSNYTGLAALDLVVKQNQHAAKWDTFFNITENGWATKYLSDHDAIDGPMTGIPKPMRELYKELGITDFTLAKQNLVAESARWIYSYTPSGKADTLSSPGPAALTHPVVRVFPHIELGVTPRNHHLWMMYRHLVRWTTDTTARIKAMFACMYAYRCVLSQYYYTEVLVPAMSHKPIMKLRESLFAFFTQYATEACLAPPKGQPNAAPSWTNWDWEDLELSLAEHATSRAESGAPDLELDIAQSKPQLESYARRGVYGHEVQRLIQMVSGLSCARGRSLRDDDKISEEMHPWVLDKLDALCNALLQNAERLEIRELTPSDDFSHPVVLPDNGIRHQHAYTLPTLSKPQSTQGSYVDIAAWRSMREWKNKAPRAYRNAFKSAIANSDTPMSLPQHVRWAEMTELFPLVQEGYEAVMSEFTERRLQTALEVKDEADDPDYVLSTEDDSDGDQAGADHEDERNAESHVKSGGKQQTAQGTKAEREYRRHDKQDHDVQEAGHHGDDPSKEHGKEHGEEHYKGCSGAHESSAGKAAAGHRGITRENRPTSSIQDDLIVEPTQPFSDRLSLTPIEFNPPRTQPLVDVDMDGSSTPLIHGKVLVPSSSGLLPHIPEGQDQPRSSSPLADAERDPTPPSLRQVLHREGLRPTHTPAPTPVTGLARITRTQPAPAVAGPSRLSHNRDKAVASASGRKQNEKKRPRSSTDSIIAPASVRPRCDDSDESSDSDGDEDAAMKPGRDL